MKRKKIINLIIGTNNPGKLREIKGLLPNKLKIYSPNKFKIKSPKENGKTFKENSLIKAKFFSNKAKMICLADDSGLEIDILDKKPGIFSSRWAGPNGNFNTAIKKVFKELSSKDKNWKNKKMKARFICSLSIYWPNGKNISRNGDIFSISNSCSTINLDDFIKTPIEIISPIGSSVTSYVEDDIILCPNSYELPDGSCINSLNVARYIRLQRVNNSGDNNWPYGINLSELIVFDINENIISKNKPVTMSSTLPGYPGSNLTDGNINTMAHTNGDINAFMEVDLGSNYNIGKIIIINRQDCCKNRAIGLEVQLLIGYPIVSNPIKISSTLLTTELNEYNLFLTSSGFGSIENIPSFSDRWDMNKSFERLFNKYFYNANIACGPYEIFDTETSTCKCDQNSVRCPRANNKCMSLEACNIIEDPNAIPYQKPSPLDIPVCDENAGYVYNSLTNTCKYRCPNGLSWWGQEFGCVNESGLGKY